MRSGSSLFFFSDIFRLHAPKCRFHLSNRCKSNRKEENKMDALLVKRAQKNDMDAFVALIEKHKTGH